MYRSRSHNENNSPTKVLHIKLDANYGHLSAMKEHCYQIIFATKPGETKQNHLILQGTSAFQQQMANTEKQHLEEAAETRANTDMIDI